MKQIYYLVFFVLLICTSCEDFLSAEDDNKIESHKYFNTVADLEIYANGFLQTMVPTASSVATGDVNTDYLARRGEYPYLTDNYGPNDQGGWAFGNWEKLRNINFFLNNFSSAVATDEEMKHYEGVARFWRAYFYYDKVGTFGGVPWYDYVIQPEDHDQLYKGRDSREFVMQKVLEDLNFAADNCITNSALEVNSAQITKYVALALKARICLYEGTYMRYHPELNIPGQEELAKKYLQESIDACEKLMESKRFSLVSDESNPDGQYRSLFIANNPLTKEVIWARVYSQDLNKYHDLTYNFTGAQAGSNLAFTKQFINTYLMKDGSRFTDKAGYEVMSFYDECQGRDLRLSQTIRTPGYKRLVNGIPTASAPDFAASPTGYMPIKWVMDDASYETTMSACYNSIPILRYAEILLNYAEAKWELGEFNSSVWDNTIKLLRQRAGVDGKEPEMADPYMQRYFNNTISDKYLLEIRRERGIELALENVRWDDLMRWKMGKLLELPWYGVYIKELNVSYDMDGDGKKDVIFIPTSKPQIVEPGVYYKELIDDFKLTNQTSGYLHAYVNSSRRWHDYKYLRPIPSSAILDNPNLEQNDGWK